ncbi:hypothetical protein [Puniceicoccus vermicola]|uniref:DUF4345 domain-containing protein n=1 Tax=Puniceicoccus vermicola TaxID=388746 RepID=A0A7X1B3X9_9BACT|nr:hypothetical protein [Puniceicoccus vermicola]MBC2603960.1 hypothetical protein [Puniceicoccus vermicola]
MANKLLFLYCLLAGTMDASTGLLLMTAPEFTLGLMGIPSVHPEAMVFIRFVGAFVFGVGSLYWLALWPVWKSGNWEWVRSCLLATAWLRLVVFVFGCVAIGTGALSLQWATVPLSDGLLAILQGWLVLTGKVPGDE